MVSPIGIKIKKYETPDEILEKLFSNQHKVI